MIHKKVLLYIVLLISMIFLSCASNQESRQKKQKAIFKEVEEGDLIALDQSFTYGLNINYPNAQHISPLMIAVENEDLTTTLFLLERGADPNYTLLNSISPFRLAIQKGNVQMVYNFIQFNAIVNQNNNDSWTPLMTASYYGHLEIVKMLVEAGADPLAHTKTGYDALWFARKNKNYELIEYLEKVKEEEEEKNARLLEQARRLRKNLEAE